MGKKSKVENSNDLYLKTNAEQVRLALAKIILEDSLYGPVTLVVDLDTLAVSVRNGLLLDTFKNLYKELMQVDRHGQITFADGGIVRLDAVGENARKWAAEVLLGEDSWKAYEDKPTASFSKAPERYSGSKGDLLEGFEGYILTPEEMRGAYKFNIIKYIRRYNQKNGMDDLNKAQVYLDRLKAFEDEKEDSKRNA